MPNDRARFLFIDNVLLRGPLLYLCVAKGTSVLCVAKGTSVLCVAKGTGVLCVAKGTSVLLITCTQVMYH